MVQEIKNVSLFQVFHKNQFGTVSIFSLFLFKLSKEYRKKMYRYYIIINLPHLRAFSVTHDYKLIKI